MASWSAEDDGYIVDIGQEARENEDYRRVLYTGENMQLVLMSLRPGEEIGEEVHELTQFLRVEEGNALVTVNGQESELGPEMAVVVPEGARHNVINTGSSDLKLYTIYTPPQHPPETVHKTKEAAEKAEED